MYMSGVVGDVKFTRKLIFSPRKSSSRVKIFFFSTEISYQASLKCLLVLADVGKPHPA
jgi:hypothetical protein